jgi:hypothetical protein
MKAIRVRVQAPRPLRAVWAWWTDICVCLSAALLDPGPSWHVHTCPDCHHARTCEGDPCFGDRCASCWAWRDASRSEVA